MIMLMGKNFQKKITGNFVSIKNSCTFATLSKERMSVNPNFGVVVQLVRIHACHAWGRGFESRPYRKECKSFGLHSFFMSKKMHQKSTKKGDIINTT